jgi:hypothetical protein
MSIFSSKKAKPREVDVDKGKPRPAGAKTQSNGQAIKNGTNAIGTAALSAGARTIQRAQIMAASRKRMDSETPDYSIHGAAKSNGTAHKSSRPAPESVSAARQAVQTSTSNGGSEPKSRTGSLPQKLAKSKPQSNDKKKKSRASSVDNVTENMTTTPIYSAMQTASQASPMQNSNGAAIASSKSSPNLSIQMTPKMPMDSPTLGYDGSFTKSEPRAAVVSSPATSLSNVNAQTQPGGIASQDVTVGRSARHDSGFVSKPATSKEMSTDPKTSKIMVNGDKPSGVHPGIRAESKTSNRSSRSSTYISKLDPGPTGSAFAEPAVESPKATTFQSPSEEGSKRPRQGSRPQKFQIPETEKRKEKISRDTEQFPPLIEPSTTKDAGSKGLNRIVAASQAQAASHPRSSASQRRKEEMPFGQQPQLSTSPGIVSPLDTAPRTYSVPAASPAAESGTYRTAPTSRSNTPQESHESKQQYAPSIGPSIDSTNMTKAADSYFGRGRTMPQIVHPEPAPNSGLPQSSTARSSISERPALPPVSILEGFKVNKRGHVLDEEGEVIGELFEGDLIDCVRQKVDANGDVLDESGVPVGRVRTIIRGTVMAPRWSISSGTSLPLSTYNWGRRDSTASQQTHQTYQSQHTFFNRTTASPVPAPAVEGNAIVAELDASTDAEAGPLIDQSEIFSPFGMSPRPDSGSGSSIANKSELPADERRGSGSSKPDAKPERKPERKPEARRESVTPDPPITRPVRKWTSRYFEQSPLDGQLPPRRNSATPDMVQSPTSIASPKTTSIYGAVGPTKSRAVIGPTLESLMEQDPTLFTTPETGKFGGSTPNLHAPQEASKGPAAQRRASTQFGPPAPGLGSRLSVSGKYQPARRSPLGSYETTPPGSGAGLEEDKSRARSLPPAARRSQRAGKMSMEAEDAAPAPEISKKRWQEKRALLAPADAERRVERRKSRFSFMLPGKKEATVA